MALMRGAPYVYSTTRSGAHGDVNGIQIHSYGSAFLSTEEAEELAVLLLGSMSAEQILEAVDRALDKHGDNFGAAGLQRRVGLPTAYDVLEKFAADVKAGREPGRWPTPEATS